MTTSFLTRLFTILFDTNTFLKPISLLSTVYYTTADMNLGLLACLLVLSILSVECAKNGITKKTDSKSNGSSLSSRRVFKYAIQPIFLRREPNNTYILESGGGSLTSNRLASNSIMLDCLPDYPKWNRNGQKPVIKWYKDNIDLESAQYSTNSDDDMKKEVLANGSLKLTYNLNGKDQQSDQPVELVSTYRCIVSDSFGKITSRPSRIYRLNDLSGSNSDVTKFVKQPTNSTLYVGKRILLRCKPNVTNYLRAINEKNTNLIQYEWFKDNKPIEITSKINLFNDGSLEIKQADESDSGFYKCVAKYRSMEFDSRQAYVKVSPLTSLKPVFKPTSTEAPATPPKFLVWPEDQNVAEDSEVILECLAANDASLYTTSRANESNPSLPTQFFKYKWLKDGVALDLNNQSNKHYQLVQGVNLRIDQVKETDTGSYTCRICNSDRDESTYSSLDDSGVETPMNGDECDERSSILKVIVPPKFQKRPSSVNVTLKSDVELECSAYGVPSPTIQWFKNGEPVYPSEYFQFSPSHGNLKILGIIAQDEGYYQCLASNELNTIQSVAKLTVIQSPTMTTTSPVYEENDVASTTVSEDYRITSTDEISQFRPNRPFNMFNSFTTLPPLKSAPFSTTVVSQVSSVHHIVHLSAPVGLKIVQEQPRFLNIEWQAPSIVRSLNSNGNDTSLMYSVNWKPVNADRQREVNVTTNSILIDDLTPDTSYLIQVGAIMASVRGPLASIQARTIVEPSYPSSPIDFKAEFIDLSLSTQSSSSSISALKLKWKRPASNWQKIVKYRLFYQHLQYGPVVVDQPKNGPMFMPNDVDKVMSKLTDEDDHFENYSPNEDEYAINDEQHNELVKDKPAGEEESQATEKFIDIDLTDELEQQTSTDGYYEFLLEDLLKYSTYKFRLIALDQKLLEGMKSGELNLTLEQSTNSAEILVETPSDVPDGPPENLRCETLNTTAILVEWDQPSVDKRNGLVVGYKISIKENEKQVWHSNVDSEPRSKIIAGLTPGNKYSVRITARTINGSGPASDWAIVETFLHEMDETKAPGQPLEIHAEPTDKSIVIHWRPPADYNRTLVRKYLLKYGIGYPETEIEIDGNKNSYIINNLIPFSPYVVSLKAVNNAGQGMEILKDVITKRKSMLDEAENLFPPLNVQAVAISPHSVELRWTDWHLKPDESIPDDRRYVIRYSVADYSTSSSAPKYTFKNATERSAIISDLKPNTLYDFAVKLAVGKRESDWSMTTSQMTMELTAAPRDIQIKSDPISPSTSVVLSWLPPTTSTTSNSDLMTTGYVISYLDEATFNENSNIRWRNEQVNTHKKGHQLSNQRVQHTIRRLKPETIYYFKIQVRNNRAYTASSPTIIFKTPNAQGEGGGKIFTPGNNENSEHQSDDVVVSLREDSKLISPSVSQSFFSKAGLEMNIVWIIALSILSVAFFSILLISIVVCRCRGQNQAPKLRDKGLMMSTSSKDSNYSSSLRKKGIHCELYDNKLGDDDEDLDLNNQETEEMFQRQSSQQEQLLMSQQKQLVARMSCSNSSAASTLMKQYQQSQQQLLSRHTPHHQPPLVINNPNHMMMSLMNPLTISNANGTNPIITNNSNTLTDFEFYSTHNNQTQQMTADDSQNLDLIRNGDMFNNESVFGRSAMTRPKPIAIPIGNANNSVSHMSSPIDPNTSGNMIHQNVNVFSSSSSTRKSMRNLTSNVNSGYANSNSPLSSNTNTQKLFYSSRPYMMDSQPQTNGDYLNHSPTSSHSSSQPQQVYDKITTVTNPNVSTKSLLQPLKSFGAASNVISPPYNHNAHAMSIPNTPAKFFDNMSIGKSPGKKPMVISARNRSGDVYNMMGKSSENIYDRAMSTNNEELTAEMANLEGIMKDLNEITAQQFEC